MPIRALIVDDERIARKGLRSLLASHPDIEVVGECGNGRAAVGAVRELAPDLLFLDVQMPALDGFAVVREIGAAHMPAEPLAIGRQQVTCSRYRLSGDLEADLWFDGQNRIVRQKTIEDGYPTEVRLTRVHRPSPRTAQRELKRSPRR